MCYFCRVAHIKSVERPTIIKLNACNDSKVTADRKKNVHIINFYNVTCWCLVKVHVRPAVRQSLRDLPETEAQRCLPADPQTQPVRLHRGQDRSPHGL